MAGFKFERFRGELPKLGDRVIDGKTATIAQDCRLDSGEVQPLYQEAAVESFVFARADWFDFRAYDDAVQTIVLDDAASAYANERYTAATERQFSYTFDRSATPSEDPLIGYGAPEVTIEHAVTGQFQDGMPGPFVFPDDGRDYVLELSIPAGALTAVLEDTWSTPNPYDTEEGYQASSHPAASTTRVTSLAPMSATKLMTCIVRGSTGFRTIIEYDWNSGTQQWDNATWVAYGLGVGTTVSAYDANNFLELRLGSASDGIYRWYRTGGAGAWSNGGNLAVGSLTITPVGICMLSDTRAVVYDHSGRMELLGLDSGTPAAAPTILATYNTPILTPGAPNWTQCARLSNDSWALGMSDGANYYLYYISYDGVSTISVGGNTTPLGVLTGRYPVIAPAEGSTDSVMIYVYQYLTGTCTISSASKFDYSGGSWSVDVAFVNDTYTTVITGATTANYVPGKAETSRDGTIVLGFNYESGTNTTAALTTIQYTPVEVYAQEDKVTTSAVMYQRVESDDGLEYTDYELSLNFELAALSEPVATANYSAVTYDRASGAVAGTVTNTATATLTGLDLATGADYASEFSARLYFEYDTPTASYAVRIEADGGDTPVNAADTLFAAGAFTFPESYRLHLQTVGEPFGDTTPHSFDYTVALNMYQSEFTGAYSEPTYYGLFDYAGVVNLAGDAPGTTAADFFGVSGVDTSGAEVTNRSLWVFTDSPAVFLGDPLRNDVYGRFYWVAEDSGLRVDSLNDVFADYATTGYDPRTGETPGVPPAGHALDLSATTKYEPDGLTLDITHAGVMTIPAFTCTGMQVDGTWSTLGTWAPDERHADMSQVAITVPETYYLVMLTDRQDYAPPIKNELSWSTFNDARFSHIKKHGVFDVAAYSGNFLSPSALEPPADGITVGLDGLILAQNWVFHWVPEGSSGFKLVSPDLAFSGVPLVGTFNDRISAYASVKSSDRTAAGIAGENSITLNRAGADDWKHHMRFTDYVEQFPPNWRLTQLFDVGSGNEWAARPDAVSPGFNPVLLTDPRRIISSEAFATQEAFFYTWDLNLSKDRWTHTTITWSGEQQGAYGWTEQFLNRLFVYEIDKNTYDALIAAGAPQLRAGTEFTAKPETPGVIHGQMGRRWFDVYGSDTSGLRMEDIPVTGISRGRINENLDAAKKEISYHIGSATSGDVFDNGGPVIIDATQGKDSVDWGAIAYPSMWSPVPAGGSYLVRDPIDAVSGGFNPANLATRNVAVTLVNQYGEEGQPLLIDVEYYGDYPRTPVDVIFEKNESVLAQYNIQKARFYRLDDDGTYYLQAEVDLVGGVNDALLTYTMDPGGALNTAFPMISVDHDLPPADVTAGIMHPNGFLILGAGNTIAPAKLGYNFAYPLEYRLEIPERVVGFGQYGDTIVCLTDERPYLITGSTPADLQISPVDLQQGCVSQRSIVEIDGNVIFASPEGLFSVGRSGVRALTEDIIGDQIWRDYVSSKMHAYNWRGAYLCFYQSGSSFAAFGIDPRDIERGIIHYTIDRIAGYRRPTDGRLFLFDGANITEWDGSDTPYTWTWKTKVLQGTFPKNPGRIRVNADTYPVTLSLWSDGDLIVDSWSIVDDEPYALPAGYLEYEFELQVQGTGRLYNVDVGETTFDLKQL